MGGRGVSTPWAPLRPTAGHTELSGRRGANGRPNEPNKGSESPTVPKGSLVHDELLCALGERMEHCSSVSPTERDTVRSLFVHSVSRAIAQRALSEPCAIACLRSLPRGVGQRAIGEPMNKCCVHPVRASSTAVFARGPMDNYSVHLPDLRVGSPESPQAAFTLGTHPQPRMWPSTSPSSHTW